MRLLSLNYGPSTPPTRTAPQALAPDDPNSPIWGPNGYAQARKNELNPALSTLQEQLDDLEKLQPANEIHEKINDVRSQLIELATTLESEGDAVKNFQLVKRLSDIRQMLDGAKAKEALKGLRAWLDSQHLSSALLLKA